MTLRLAVISAAMLAVLPTTSAEAGAFNITACAQAPNAANNAWVPANTDESAVATADRCGEGGLYGGLTVSEILGAGAPITSGDSGAWVITAPPGSRIKQLDYQRWAHLYSDEGWRPEVRTQQGQVLETCTFAGEPWECGFGLLGGARVIRDVDTSALIFEGYCAPAYFGVCERGATLHRLEMVLYGATVTVDDTADPVLANVSSPFADGGWHRGVWTSVSAEASDNTGIRERKVVVDGVVRATEVAPAADEGGCGTLNEGLAYTYTEPCAGIRGLGGDRASGVSSAGWPEGTHELRLRVVDTGGRETTSGPLAIKVDRTAPSPAQISADTGWSNASGGEVAWTVAPETDRSPIADVHVEMCGPAGCSAEALGPATFGATLEHTIAALPEGATTVRIRHVDAAVNVGEWSSGTVLRRDRTPPTVTAIEPPDTVAGGARIEFAAEGKDSLSGVDRIERQFQIDGEEWRPFPQDLTAHPGRAYRFRARAFDRAQNAGAWATTGTTRATTAPATQIQAPIEPPHLAPPAQQRPKLEITRAKLSTTTLRVTGTTTATGRVTITFTATRRGRTRRATKRATIAKNAFRATIKLPRALRATKRGTLTVRLAGNPRRQVSRRIRRS